MDMDLPHVPPEWPKAQALFRMQMIWPLVDPLSNAEERRDWRQKVTGRLHTLPDGTERTISERTLRRWVSQYRAAGLDGLLRAPVRKGTLLRKLTPEVIERATELKEEDPRRSIPHIMRLIETERGESLGVTPDAIWRHLRKVGLGGRSLTPVQALRRFEADAANDLWQSDVMHGPYLPDPLDPDSKRKTYLIGFIDDHSRFVTHAEWYFAEDLYALELCFQKALLRRGKPKRVYVDRGQTFQSQVFRTACAELGIRHISATAYHPAAKGKIERFWKTVQAEFVIELEHAKVDTLAELNERFWAWLDEVYHNRVHSSTGMTPLARFVAQEPELIKDPSLIADAFLWRAMRVVDKTGCLSFQGNSYQTQGGLEGKKVQIRYHPLHLEALQVWVGDRRFENAIPLDLRNQTMKRVNPRHQTPSEKPPTAYLETLVGNHKERKRQILSPLQLSQDKERSE